MALTYWPSLLKNRDLYLKNNCDLDLLTLTAKKSINISNNNCDLDLLTLTVINLFIFRNNCDLDLLTLTAKNIFCSMEAVIWRYFNTTHLCHQHRARPARLTRLYTVSYAITSSHLDIPKMIMDIPINGRWIIPIKKFSRLRVNEDMTSTYYYKLR